MPSKHGKRVEELKKVLLDLNLPILPLNTVKSAFYVPDIVTRIDTRFIPIDLINTHSRVTFDIGGLVLISGKDIVDYAVAVIDDELWGKEVRDFRIAKLNLPPRVTMIRLSEVAHWFKGRIK